MPSRVEQLINRYHELSKIRLHRGRCSEEKRRLEAAKYTAAQREQFNIVQALTKLYDPDLYNDLEETRRAIMHHVESTINASINSKGESHEAIIPSTPFHVETQNIRYLTWRVCEITPEVSYDLSLASVEVPNSLCLKLGKLLKNQHRLVNAILA